MKKVDGNEEMARLLGRQWPLAELPKPSVGDAGTPSHDKPLREEYGVPLSFDRLSPIA
ncbi:MAG TPA: hypothetical protein VHP58_06610 [Alphaproteobacteria bacterium]|nr:hypothetical protein [Alphaproteobacteria bacterium]